jgi:hypothetical protein
MSSLPNLPGEAEIDDETKRILTERLATLKENETPTKPWDDVKAEILRNLQRPASR